MKTLITAFALLLGLHATAQNYEDIVTLLHADLRTEKDTIVMATLHLDAAQRALFLPIYKEYAAALKTHWEKRAVLIDDYAQAKETLDDATAISLMKRMSALDLEFISIRDSYAKKAAKVLPGTIAARWAQIERRLNQLLELQVANEVPLMPVKQ